MSILKVANVHFEATGSNRIDYVGGDNIVRVSSGAIKLPVGDTASRPTAEAGLIRYNSESGTFEGRNASAWGAIGGAVDLSAPFNAANTAQYTANLAFDKANVAFNLANSDVFFANLSSSTVATFTEFNSATSSKLLAAASVWNDLAVLTDGATIAVDFNNGYDFGGSTNAVLELGGNRTLDAPSNARNGKKGVLWFGATGSTRTLTLNAAWLLMDGVEVGPYSITTSQILGVAYAIRGTAVYVTAILRRAA